MTTEAIETLQSEFERVRRTMVKHEGDKGVPFEREYARLYDRLAMLSVGGRRRLRGKYRG